jgi:nickel-dependent lactate racemase
MSTQSITLLWGKKNISLDIPPDWKIMGILEPASIAGVPNLNQEIFRSLNSPVGAARLSEIVNAKSKVALIMDDLSRPTPIAKLIPAVLNELKQAGVKTDNIMVIPALGVHRPMLEKEVFQRMGLDGLHWENPDCDSTDKLTFLGNSSRGVPIYVNKTVASADVVVLIGCIEPHIIASFGGGYKNLFPGVAGRETIARNHSLNARPDTFNMVGQPINKNPMRLDLEEAGQMLKKPVFLINAVLNSKLEVVRIVSGDPIAAHREGVKVSEQIYGVKVPHQADVVITNSFPMETDLRQGVKALANTIRAVKPGGTLIVLVRAEEGVGVFGLAERKLPVGRAGLKLLSPLLLTILPKIQLKGLGEEDRFFLYFALQAMRHCEILMYAPTIPTEIQERLPFVSFVNSPEDGLQKARASQKSAAEVLVFPLGGITYPILTD